MNKSTEVRKKYTETRNKTMIQINELMTQFNELSKRKPNDAINIFKLEIINEMLTRANSILRSDHIPLKGFREFSESSLPSNSDVLLVLGQYSEALATQRSYDQPLNRVLEELSEEYQ